MGTTAYGGKGSKRRAANGDRPIGAGQLQRRTIHQGDMPKPPHPPFHPNCKNPVNPTAISRVFLFC